MENITVEYKREVTDGLEKEVVAFLNTIGGRILIGVSDNGEIVGVQNADKLALSIIDRIKNNIMPSAMGIFNVDVESLTNKYIVITVAQGLEKPYFLKKYGMTPNGCFYRIGSQSTPMPQSMIDNLFARRIINTLHNVVSPNQYLTFSQLKIFYEEKGYDVDNEYFLRNLDLFTEDGKYNYAAYLLADNNGTSIKVARFNGTEKLDIVERNEFGRCCLIKSALNVIDRLKMLNTTVVRVGSSAQRKEYHLVDSDALRETVLNAILHNDYINGAYPVFEIYDDRIEIISTGGLPVGLSTEEFFKGRSMPRNKELMRIFSDLNLCEQLGSGMKKILKVYPEGVFTISDHFVIAKFNYDKEALLILGNQTTQNDSTKKNETVNTILGNAMNEPINESLELSRSVSEILSYVTRENTVTIDTLTLELGLSRETVKRGLRFLRDNGYIKRVGSRKNGHYVVLKK